MKFQKSSGAYLPLDTESCTVTRMGDIVEVRTMTANPTGLRSITKISKDQYILNETGEVKDYQHGENRACNVSSLKQTFKATLPRYRIFFSCGTSSSRCLALPYFDERYQFQKTLHTEFRDGTPLGTWMDYDKAFESL